MKTVKPNQGLVYPALVFLLSISLASCNIPLPFQTPTAVPGLSDAVLTQAAATIFAEVAATQTQQALARPSETATVAIPTPVAPTATQEQPAAPPPQVSPPAPYPTPESSPTVISPPPLPSATLAPVYPPTVTAYPTAVQNWGGPVPTVAITPYAPVYSYMPASTRVVQMGTHFYVDNVNLAMCFGYYWSVFAIYNNGTNNLESASVTVQDLSTGRFLYGPVTDNYPFMWADNTCEAGYIDTLISGGMLFVGGRLNDPAIKFHTLGATIKLCSQDSLKGACFTKQLEFVVP